MREAVLTRTESEISEAFLKLSQVEKAIVLAEIAHFETVLVRTLYPPAQAGIEIFRRENEFLHRLCGHISAVLRGESSQDQDASFIAMVVGAIARRGEDALSRLAGIVAIKGTKP